MPTHLALGASAASGINPDVLGDDRSNAVNRPVRQVAVLEKLSAAMLAVELNQCSSDLDLHLRYSR